MIKNFGNTWWGEKWLNAFSNITYENRLPRGKSYARSGAVLNVDIKRNKINASVQGSRRQPYKIEIVIPEFTKKEKQEILNIIQGNTFYLSNLLTRKMPANLYESLAAKKIHLFPRSWKDLKATCSCPDWAVPCKHIAAVIYLIANEIDKNPFLVFSLHNFDILNELKNAGLDIQQSENSSIKSVNDVLKEGFIESENFILKKEAFEKLDFSQIPNLKDELLSLLPPNPLFYSGKDFKIFLAKMYKNIGGKINELLWKFDDFGSKTENEKKHFLESLKIKLTVDSELVLKVDLEKSAHQDDWIASSGTFPFLLTSLKDIGVAALENSADKLIAFYYIYHFTLVLIEQSAFIPQIIKITENKYHIRWIPALLNDKVSQSFKNLLEIIPYDYVALYPTFTKGMKTKEKINKIISKEEQLLAVISAILEFFILEYFSENIDISEDILLDFFTPQNLIIEDFESKELPQTISLWLSKFYIAHKDNAPILKIEENFNGFTMEILVDNVKNPLEESIPLKKIFRLEKYKQIRAEILKDLTIISEQFKEIEKIIATKGEEKIKFSPRQFTNILFSILPVVKLLGIKILLPKGLESLIKPKLSLRVEQKKSAALKSYLSLSEMLDFEWQIALGDKLISVAEFTKLVKKTNGIVKMQDQYVYIDEKDIDKILKQSDRDPKLAPHQLAEILFARSYEGAGIELTADILNLIHSLTEIKETVIPKGIKADLREYQKRGFGWLYKNAKLNLGSLIADDMGLGKTIQVITALLKLKEEKIINSDPGIIIAPTTLLSNWEKEIEKFAPSLKTFIYHGQLRKLKDSKADLIITTYGLIKRDMEKFKERKWPFIVIDEAQNIKNPDTQQTKAVKSLKSDIKIAMSGTPVENRLSEYWSIMDFLNQGQLGNLNYFKQQFAKPIEMNRDHQRLETFKKITAPFILRRVKTDKTVIKDLPKKIEIDQFSELTAKQASLYKNILDETLKKIAGSEGIERKGLIFKLMTALKQVCNHPAHYLKKKEAASEDSGKASLLLDILNNINESGEKALIFTQYTEMGNLLTKIINDKFGISPLFLHGSLNRKKRDEIVESFQSEKSERIMILSLKAGGTGLNLTAATNVIHYDLWWNPAVEAQATDRAFRIGQKKNVMVYRFITKGTFEEKIDKMIKDKKELADLVVNNGERWIGELSNKDLKEVFGLEK